MSTVSPLENPLVPVTSTVPEGIIEGADSAMWPAGFAACAVTLGTRAARRAMPMTSVRTRRAARGGRIKPRPPCE